MKANSLEKVDLILSCCYGVLTLADTETDKKMGCKELCLGVHTAEKKTSTQISIVLCLIYQYLCLSRSLCLSQDRVV